MVEQKNQLGCTVYRERVREIERGGDWERGNDQAVAYELHPCGMLLITATEPLVQYTPTPVTYPLVCSVLSFISSTLGVSALYNVICYFKTMCVSPSN